MQRKRIVVMGFMGSIPIAGVIWQHVHYIVGLQRLGHEVYYIEDSSRLPYDPVAAEITNDDRYAVAKLGELARQFGFDGRWAWCARYLPGLPCVGLSRAQIHEIYRTADAVLNICGTQEFHEDLDQCDRMIYVESDPGLEQIRIDNGDPDQRAYLDRHRALFTFGENIGTERFPVPLHGLRWHTTRQPVVTDLWRTDAAPGNAAVFTSVANWDTSGKKDIEWRGERYLWSKSLEFLKFIDAPKWAGETLELATTVREPEIAQRFTGAGWRLVNPDAMSLQHDEYAAYIRGSKGEFTVAKDQYVRLDTGWFSDRSACYLAAGRPVVTQETGFTRLYGGDAGLFAFREPGEIAAAVRAINGDYARHGRAAAEIAAEYFEAAKVLGELLERAGV